DITDHNLPLMYWYAAEPLAGEDADKALALAAKAKMPNLLPFMARRIASAGTPKALGAVVARLEKTSPVSEQRAILRSMQEGLAGQRNLPAPDGWKDLSAKLTAAEDAEVRNRA